MIENPPQPLPSFRRGGIYYGRLPRVAPAQMQRGWVTRGYYRSTPPGCLITDRAKTGNLFRSVHICSPLAGIEESFLRRRAALREFKVPGLKFEVAGGERGGRCRVPVVPSRSFGCLPLGRSEAVEKAPGGWRSPRPAAPGFRRVRRVPSDISVKRQVTSDRSWVGKKDRGRGRFSEGLQTRWCVVTAF